MLPFKENFFLFVSCLFVVLGSFLVGSIPFGVIFAKLNGIDLKSVGSGNTGATNAGRALGLKFGILVALLDGLKGFFCGALTAYLTGKSDLAMVAVFAAILGHCYSVFLKFNGGKGVATFAVGLLSIKQELFTIFIIVFVVTFLLSRYVSLSCLSGVFGCLLYCFVSMVLNTGSYDKNPFLNSESEVSDIIFLGASFVLISFRHVPNIQRLFLGKEKRFNIPKLF